MHLTDFNIGKKNLSLPARLTENLALPFPHTLGWQRIAKSL